MHDWKRKLDSGEFLYKWNGYTPFWAGCFASNVDLGGEEKFSHCYDYFSGIGDVEWWIKSELDKLSELEKNELLSILHRNKQFHDEIRTPSRIQALSAYFGVDTTVLYRMGAKNLYQLMMPLNDSYNSIIKSFNREIDSTPKFGKFDVFMHENFEEELEIPPIEIRNDLFSYGSQIIYAPVLD